ncbi:hypothetical protein GCM10020358_25800 [Amorphoplanes nipponensis]|uniref:Uncharacterized protein n=1 Tax=Actinoplanes nipponensis TaxID=135950 RepID=A0A919JPN3_9ACTN|nr:hypothetical protein Ani05nite_65740 [Actinoplanes nipponensis]
MRVTSVRRTVRVAVALVIGQALLCGIIGFLTFGGRGEPAPGARAAEPQLAGPPLVAPAPSVPPDGDRPERRKPGVARTSRTQRPAAPPASAAVRNSATRLIGPSPTVPPPPAAAPVPPPTPTTSPTDRSLLPPSSPVSGDDPPVPVVGEPCEEEGATGRTADGKAVRCERDPDGDLRWSLV